MAASVSSFAQVADWFSTTSPKTITGLSWNAGDVVVVVGGTENANLATLSAPTNANLTFTLRASSVLDGTEATVYLWSAVAGSSQTGQTISVAKTGIGQFGFAVWVCPGGSGSFANASADFTESAFTFTPTAGSAVIYAHFDWSATTGKTITTGTGTATERLDFGNGTTYGGWAGDWQGVTNSSASFGITSYTGTQVARAVIEVLAAATAAPSAPTVGYHPDDTYLQEDERGGYLLEDGSGLLELQPTIEFDPGDQYLLENGDRLLAENGADLFQLEARTEFYLGDMLQLEPLAPELAAYETDWTSTTDPKTLVIPGCLKDDWLFMVGGSGQIGGSDITAIATTTTGGSTTAWSEPQESLNVPQAEAWISSAAAQVTAAGDVTVQVDPTKAGSPAWGFTVVRARGSQGLGSSAFVDSSATERAQLTVEQGSGVLFVSVDFDAGAAGTGFSPAGATEIERSTPGGNYTVHAAYWPNQDAGTRSYGSVGAGGAGRKSIALEIKGFSGGYQLEDGSGLFQLETMIEFDPGDTIQQEDQAGSPQGQILLEDASGGYQLEPTTGPPSVALAPAQITLTPVALQPSQTVALAAATMTLSAQPILPAAVVALDPATITLSPQPILATPSVALAPATMTLTPQPVSPVTGVTLAPATMTLSPVPLVPSQSVALDPATITLTPVALQPSQSVALSPATITLTPQPILPAAIIPLSPATITLSPSALQPSRAVALAAATVTLSPQPLAPSQSVALVAAVMTLSPQPLSVQGTGAVNLAPATITLTPQPIVATPSVALAPAQITLTARPLVATPAVALSPAQITLLPQPILATPSVPLAPALITLTPQPLSPFGQASVNLAPALITLTPPPLNPFMSEGVGKLTGYLTGGRLTGTIPAGRLSGQLTPNRLEGSL